MINYEHAYVYALFSVTLPSGSIRQSFTELRSYPTVLMKNRRRFLHDLKGMAEDFAKQTYSPLNFKIRIIKAYYRPAICRYDERNRVTYLSTRTGQDLKPGVLS